MTSYTTSSYTDSSYFVSDVLPPLEATDLKIRLSGGTYLQLDGINDFVDLGSHTDLWSQSLSKFSVSLWIYPTAVNDGQNREVFDHGSGSAHGFEVEIDDATSGEIRFTCKNSANTAFNATSNTLVANQWQNIICTYDNSLGSANVKIFVNDVQGGTTANLTESLNNAGIMEIGSPSNDLQGFARDLRFWKSIALDATQRANVIINSPSAPTPDYWLKLDEGTGNPVDSIGAKTTTLTNGATWFVNSDFNASLGGIKSATEVVNNFNNNIFDDVSSGEHSAGDTEYRCVYLHNSSSTTPMNNIKIYIASNTSATEDEWDIGLGTSGLNGTEQTIANESTAPISVTFLHPIVEADGLIPPDIPIGQHVALWFRRTVNAGTSTVSDVNITIKYAFDES